MRSIVFVMGLLYAFKDKDSAANTKTGKDTHPVRGDRKTVSFGVCLFNFAVVAVANIRELGPIRLPLSGYFTRLA